MQKARGHIASNAPTACKQTVSGTISLPSQGYFSPFPHGTGTLSVAKSYLALCDGPHKFPQNFSCSAVLGNTTSKIDDFHIQDCHLLRFGFPANSVNHQFSDSPPDPKLWQVISHDPAYATLSGLTRMRFGLVPVRSPLLGKSLLFSFPGGTKMFQFSPLHSIRYGFTHGWHSINHAGLPHSEISGSMGV